MELLDLDGYWVNPQHIVTIEEETQLVDDTETTLFLVEFVSGKSVTLDEARGRELLEHFGRTSP